MSAATTASSPTLGDVLVQDGALTSAKLADIQARAARENLPLDQAIISSGAVREEDVLRARSKLYNIPTVDLFGKIVRGEVLNIIPVELAQNYKMIAFDHALDEVSVAMVDPTNFQALDAIEYIARKNNWRIKYFLTSEAGLKYILRQYENLSTEVEAALKGAEDIASRDLDKIDLSDEGLEEVVKTAPVSKIVSIVLRFAVEGKASDIHIEPFGKETRIRYRVDGILHTSLTLPITIHPAIVSRIKVMSNLKTDETRVPQDGRFRTVIDGRDIDYRVSTLPLINAEKVVMRILDTSSSLINLTNLGFEGRNLEVMKDGIERSHGMFLITGPTGSGKSTTLYALMNILNEEGVNIVTLEDPVEYFLRGINQSQVNPEVGLSFAAGLRSILRQDPDIVMVGEIRDAETAELSVHAALTGHIVLSTLHTNDAFGAVPRMIDMKIEPFLLASSLNIVMAQRLVRRICDYCKREIHLPPAMEQEALKAIEPLPKKSWPTDLKYESPLTFYEGVGCARCENTGYKGRVAISEVLEINEEIKRIIIDGGNLIDNIQTAFLNQGMYLMKQDGVFKALHGHTTLAEVWDATRA